MTKRVSVSVRFLGALLATAVALAACSRQQPAQKAPVIAVESFLADFVGQVAGDRLAVRSLVPPGVDPHGYEPTPQDVAAVATARAIVENGAGLESFMAKLLANAGTGRPVIVASAGLVSRTGREGEVLEGGAIATGPSTDPDPHFWLDPTKVEIYVQNIRDGLIRIDPAGEPVYRANADAYNAKLRELDAWIAEQVAVLPVSERKLVTNHESFGYFADRYGFRIIGTVIPSVSTEASPTARQLARLVDGLKAAGARAVFLETGASPQLANQVAQEAGIPVVTELYTHSLSDASGPAATYIAMMQYDVKTIIDSLGRGAR
ncbi:MAG: metal ABC transporter substrate-binding protein [Spirochaetia bacterium]|jgi:ABC-type Zn uptake system ZnuABC Zn-binding protein ZnuA